MRRYKMAAHALNRRVLLELQLGGVQCNQPRNAPLKSPQGRVDLPLWVEWTHDVEAWEVLEAADTLMQSISCPQTSSKPSQSEQQLSVYFLYSTALRLLEKERLEEMTEMPKDGQQLAACDVQRQYLHNQSVAAAKGLQKALRLIVQ